MMEMTQKALYDFFMAVVGKKIRWHTWEPGRWFIPKSWNGEGFITGNGADGEHDTYAIFEGLGNCGWSFVEEKSANKRYDDELRFFKQVEGKKIRLKGWDNDNFFIPKAMTPSGILVGENKSGFRATFPVKFAFADWDFVTDDESSESLRDRKVFFKAVKDKRIRKKEWHKAKWFSPNRMGCDGIMYGWDNDGRIVRYLVDGGFDVWSFYVDYEDISGMPFGYSILEELFKKMAVHPKPSPSVKPIPRISVTVRDGEKLTDKEVKWITDWMNDMVSFQLKKFRKTDPYFRGEVEFQYHL